MRRRRQRKQVLLDQLPVLASSCKRNLQDIWRIPSGMRSRDAIGVLDNYMTALMAFERKVSATENDMIFINVGISDIGLAAVDLATNVFKAQVRRETLVEFL